MTILEYGKGRIKLFGTFIILMKGATSYEFQVGPYYGGYCHLKGMPSGYNRWHPIRKDPEWTFRPQ